MARARYKFYARDRVERAIRLVVVRNALEAHAEFLHHVPRGRVLRYGDGDDSVVATHRDKGQRGDKTLDQDETLTFTISAGKFTRLVENHSDQAAYDAFWS